MKPLLQLNRQRPATLRQKQSEFARMLPLLIQFAIQQGYEVTLGDAWAFNFWPIVTLINRFLSRNRLKGLKARIHSRKSFHYKRLAIDLNLFKNGKYLRSTKAHQPLGEFWETIGGTWGGRFKSPDGNHYSLGEK